MATSTHWTYEQIDRRRMRDVEGLNRYWRKCPPVHIALARFAALQGSPVVLEEEQPEQRHPDAAKSFEELEAEATAELSWMEA